VSTTTVSYNKVNGTATANISGGTAPYTYSWNTTPVQTGSTITGLTAGTYVVTVNDNSGCTITISGTVAQNGAHITVDTNDSTDLAITGVTVNSIPTTHITGTMPNVPGTSALLGTTQVGTYTVEIGYSSTTVDQHITMTDSNGVIYCGNNSPLNGILTFTTVDVASVPRIIIVASDGLCP
jgi:hypothetical protein